MRSRVRNFARDLAAFSFLLYAASAAMAQVPSHATPAVPNDFEDAEFWDEAETAPDADFEDEFATYSLETDESQLEAAHKAYLRDGALQLVRPESEPIDIQPVEPPAWIEALLRFLGTLAPILQIIFWGAIALVVMAILYFLFGEAVRVRLGFKPIKAPKRQDDVLPDIRPDADKARTLLEEADALAREGRFAEAVHLLLFRSIEDIQERLEGGVPSSLTAREIAGLGNLPKRAKHALGPIIQIVEHSFFGGQTVDGNGWQNARRSYEEFAFGEGWA
ncbi:hypothetical protein K1X12_13625 [Hyphomonas sp. WL0036]|uniref:hypothetical protein n=1 Tax=Hyphomonas sediminis TaxID=2866160 RepID=UPI001C7E7FA8|nr:hypothetical protein [Hyphomonas sediminis]MBY9067945.1 hypothetical protein [Hyphomonas sediminis]